MPATTDLGDIITSTPWIDTHEHIVEERGRLTGETFRCITMQDIEELIAPGWPSLLSQIVIEDLVSARSRPTTVDGP